MVIILWVQVILVEEVLEILSLVFVLLFFTYVILDKLVMGFNFFI